MGVATRRYRLEVALRYIEDKHQRRIYMEVGKSVTTQGTLCASS